MDESLQICSACGAPLLHKKQVPTGESLSHGNNPQGSKDCSPVPPKKRRKLPIIIVVAILLIFSMSMCSGTSSDPIEGDWIIYEVLSDGESSGPIGIEDFTFSFSSDGTGEMSLISGGFSSFSWEYTENLDGDADDVRAYTLSFDSGGIQVVFIDQGNLFVVYDDEDLVFIFESAN